MTDVQMDIKAKAAELGISPDKLDLPEYPDFRDEKGYRLRVYAAENMTSPKGASQVQLSVNALDEDDKVVKFARSRLWLTYPFDNAEFKFRDKDAFERSYNDMRTLLLCGGDNALGLYADYVRKVQDGNKAHFFDAEGNELKNPEWKLYKQQRRINVFTALRAREQDASQWMDTTFYAQRKYNEKDGVVYRNWQRLSVQPLSAVQYITTPSQMLSRPASGDEGTDDAEILF